jgi:AcrR family transcriptional regulator
VALELVAERGVAGFSMAEASRRLGVSVSAPYAHFPDRDALIAAAAVRAWHSFHALVADEIGAATTPNDRLAGAARAYVRFAGLERPLFDVLYRSGVDKHRHPHLLAAEEQLSDLLLDCVQKVAGRDKDLVDELAAAVEATAEGYAITLFDGNFDAGDKEIDIAAQRAGAAVLALIRGRQLLRRAGPDR